MELPANNQYDILGTIKNYGLFNQEIPAVPYDKPSTGLMENLQKASEDFAATREKQRKESQDRFKTMVELGDYEGAKRDFITGYLGDNFQQMTPEQEAQFRQNFEMSRQQKRNEVYQTQLADAQKRGDADTVIKLTEQIYGQPLDEPRKEYIRRSAQASRIKETAAIIEDLKNSPPTVSYPVISELLKSSGMPVPTFVEFLKTYYPPRATGTQSNVTAQNMRQLFDQQMKQIGEDKTAIADIDSQMKYTSNDGGAATSKYKQAMQERQRLLMEIQGAFLAGNDAGLINSAMTAYQGFMANTYLPAQQEFYQSRGMGIQGRDVQARTQLSQANAALARARRQEVVNLMGVRREKMVAETQAAAERVRVSRALTPARKQFLESQAELNQYLQSNSPRMWQAALGMLGRQERADIEAGKTEDQILASRDTRLQKNLEAILDLDTELLDKGVDRKYMSTQPGRELAAEMLNRATSGEPLEDMLPSVSGLVAPTTTTSRSTTTAPRPATTTSRSTTTTSRPANVPTQLPGRPLPQSPLTGKPGDVPVVVVPGAQARARAERLARNAANPLGSPRVDKAAEAQRKERARLRPIVIKNLKDQFGTTPTEQAIEAALDIKMRQFNSRTK